ncbi:dna-directed rna polymerase i rpa12 [Cystoisospora suis]|uniref:Dna-directed rna polymerase i rpa12 n=1 Tax=Cystoisospora suis TaxID=483139 RepID=A0A2C6KQQ8_9APIC|nr:dna-directed rna polymerase i rpa12 [Cystoisospora suis]
MSTPSHPISPDALLLADAALSFVGSLSSDSGSTDPSFSVCRSLLNQDPKSLDDAVEYFALSHRLGEDAKTVNGPPKFSYESPGLFFDYPAFSDATSAQVGETSPRKDAKKEKASRRDAGTRSASSLSPQESVAVGRGPGVSCSPGISFDWLLALGCLNCGKPLSVAGDLLPSIEEALGLDGDKFSSAEETSSAGGSPVPPSLVCRACGHRVCPLHQANDSDSLVDAMRASTAATSQRQQLSHPLAQDGIYLFGHRKQHRLGAFTKRWWQQRFLGSRFTEKQLQQQLRLVEAMMKTGAKRGVMCKEICEKCGHDEAFFSTFQARSADEGMTVMYECAKCRHRRVFNN